ncbi:unnamed protein product [Brassica oleracea var. botrytis]
MDGRHVFHKWKEQEDQKTASKFDDVYLKISVKVILWGIYYIIVRTDSKFDVVIFKRIFMSKVNKAPLTCAKMV